MRPSGLDRHRGVGACRSRFARLSECGSRRKPWTANATASGSLERSSTLSASSLFGSSSQVSLYVRPISHRCPAVLCCPAEKLTPRPGVDRLAPMRLLGLLIKAGTGDRRTGQTDAVGNYTFVNLTPVPLPFPLPPRPPTQGAGSRRSVSNSGAGRTTA